MEDENGDCNKVSANSFFATRMRDELEHTTFLSLLLRPKPVILKLWKNICHVRCKAETFSFSVIKLSKTNQQICTEICHHLWKQQQNKPNKKYLKKLSKLYLLLLCRYCLLFFNESLPPFLPTFRYGRVQSVKIFVSPGTAGRSAATTIVPISQFSPSGGTITSTSEISLAGGKHQSGGSVSSDDQQQDQHNLSSTITSKCKSQQPTATSAGAAAGHSLLEPIGVNSCSVSINNVTSSNQNCIITMCAATIAFVDIKSASKAHLAEHKFEDRLLTTEYYEPSTMLGSSMDSGEGAVIGGEKDERAAVSRHHEQQQRFATNTASNTTTTNHGHGLVCGSCDDDLSWLCMQFEESNENAIRHIQSHARLLPPPIKQKVLIICSGCASLFYYSSL